MYINLGPITTWGLRYCLVTSQLLHQSGVALRVSSLPLAPGIVQADSVTCAPNTDRASVTGQEQSTKQLLSYFFLLINKVTK